MADFHASDDIRPKSAVVQVSEISDRSVNPRPLCNRGAPGSTGSQVNDDYLTGQRLREITGCEDLKMVITLDMQFDTDRMAAGNFGVYLPNLKQLRLSNSNIRTVRDLGTGLNNLEVAWMPRCCLISLDGISSFTKLVELYVAFNEISDLSPCAMLDIIELIDLEGNLIEDKSSLSYLHLCRNLTTITLEGNPLVTKCGGKIRYRKIVKKMLPQITVLDDIPIQNNPTSNLGEYDITKFDSEWEYINTVLKEIGLLSVTKKSNIRSNKSRDTIVNAETIEPGRSSLGLRPTSAIKQRYQENSLQHITMDNDNPTTQASRSSSVIMDAEVFSDEEGRVSELTTGEVICGGISAALRNRRFSAQLTATATNKPIPTFSKTENLLPCNENHSSEIKANEANESFPTKANNISTNVECDDILNEESSLRQECDLVLKELAAWRKMYSQSKVFKSCRRAKMIPKITKSDSESDTILLSTDSDNPLDHEGSENMVNCEDKRTRHSDVKSKNNLQSTNCRRKDKLNKKSMNLTENKAKCDSQKNNNTQCKMNSSTDESHIKTNYSSYSVDDRSINHQSNSTKLNSSLSSFLPILQTNGKSIKVDSPVSSSSSSCSPRKQAPEQSTSGVESSFDEQMVVNNDNSIQDLQVTKSSVKNDPSSPSSPPEPPLHQLKQKQSEFSKMKTSKSPVVYANHRINKTESGNKLAMRMSRTSSTTIQALPSKPLVKREKIE
uniref:Leucine-rich repeat-containing protein 56 n=1 Tax=Trichobilharzia regenti TaxID=157069 RepID=A0AA85KBA6_TRIRE|nr:unnamed protein product [Trichobilharzia regenti]